MVIVTGDTHRDFDRILISVRNVEQQKMIYWSYLGMRESITILMKRITS